MEVMAEESSVIGYWEKDKVLGTGGFGVVTLWRNRVNNEMIALKKCRWESDMLLTPKHKERWSKEVEIMMRLSHPNVVRAIAVPGDLLSLRVELPLLCMEYCSKGDLRQILNRPENCCGLLEHDVRCLISDVKEAVEYLHREKITHRDLKPENIVLQERSDSEVVYKLIDLGYAKELEQSSVCTSFVGTLQYLAPELFTSKSYTSSVDYWSLGLVAHEVITGMRPFLPNMTPASWMSHVRGKSSNHICVYQNVDGDIEFSEQMFPENRITQCLRYEFEHWLRLALEWDPKKRGRSDTDNKLIVFSQLEAILKKKIVTVFSVASYQSLSYEVDSATSIGTLKQWIERDTRLPAEKQVLLQPNGDSLSSDDLALSAWESNMQGAMVYAFSCNGMCLPSVLPNTPQLVKRLMEQPKALMEYARQKRAWAHAAYFLSQEALLYQALLDAYAVKMLSLIGRSARLGKLQQAVQQELHQLEAVHGLNRDSLDFDNKCYRKLHDSTNASNKCVELVGELVAGWVERLTEISRKVVQLRDIADKMALRVDAAETRVTALQDSVEPGPKESAEFDMLMQAGYKCYNNLRRRSKEAREKKTDSVDMVKVVYKCLKLRDCALRDPDMSAHLHELAESEKELTSLEAPLGALRVHIDKYKKELTRCQLVRQKDMWQVVVKLKEKCEHLQKACPVLDNGCTQSQFLSPLSISRPASLKLQAAANTSLSPPSQSIPDPTVTTAMTTVSQKGFDLSRTQQPALNVSGVPRQPGGQPDGLDTQSMISDNQDLRYALQDCMAHTFQKYQQLMAESGSMDWDFHK